MSKSCETCEHWGALKGDGTGPMRPCRALVPQWLIKAAERQEPATGCPFTGAHYGDRCEAYVEKPLAPERKEKE